jgi:hypothetical protein
MARLVVVMLLAGATYPSAVRAVRHRMTNVDLVAARLRETVKPGDLVLVNHWHLGISFNRYYDCPARCLTVPPIGFHRLPRYDLIKQQMMLADQTLPARQVTAQMGDALRAAHRVFIVGHIDLPSGGQPVAPLPPAPLPGNAPWLANVYETQWSLMIGYFLKQHSTTLVPVRVQVPGAVNAYENAQLFVASGWRR